MDRSASNLARRHTRALGKLIWGQKHPSAFTERVVQGESLVEPRETGPNASAV